MLNRIEPLVLVCAKYTAMVFIALSAVTVIVALLIGLTMCTTPEAPQITFDQVTAYTSTDMAAGESSEVDGDFQETREVEERWGRRIAALARAIPNTNPQPLHEVLVGWVKCFPDKVRGQYLTGLETVVRKAKENKKSTEDILNHLDGYQMLFASRYSEAEVEAAEDEPGRYLALGTAGAVLLVFLGFTSLLALLRIEKNTRKS